MIQNETYILSTYTYRRDIPVSLAWERCSKDFNRYVQRLRRLHNSSIQYIRAIESHRDGFPHLHAVLRFPIVLTISNIRYFDRTLYAKWKQLWPSGFSDYHLATNGKTSTLYACKYATKDYSRRILKRLNVPSADSSPILPKVSTSLPNLVSTLYAPPVPIIIRESSITKQCKKYSLRQTKWSRNFFKNDLSNFTQLDLI